MKLQMVFGPSFHRRHISMLGEDVVLNLVFLIINLTNAPHLAFKEVFGRALRAQ